MISGIAFSGPRDPHHGAASMHRSLRFLPAIAVLVSTGACATLSKKENGAIIGATAGAAAGAVIGYQMDQQAKEIKQNIPGAIVERVGEGLQVTFESGLLFDYDSDVLRAPARDNLATLAASLDKYPGTNVVIVGHTDSRGSDD